jgi:hypothetical protein
MSTGTQATGGSTTSTRPKRTRTKTKSRRRQNTVTAKRFFDLVVLVIGEKSGYTPNQAVPMREVEEEVLRLADLTPKERTSHDEKFLRRKIGFAFRNRRAEHVRGLTALTVQTAPKQWALTEAGVAKARELSASAEDLPPEPVVEDLPPEPHSEEVEVEELKTAGDVEAAADEVVVAEVAEKPKTTKKRKRGPRSISEVTS